VIIDDPQENNSQILSWYVQNIRQSEGAIVHLLDETRDIKFNQNGKYSFISGLIFGFGKKLLMLAHDKYSSPIDFSDLLFVHKTSDECSLHAKKWLSEIQQKISIESGKIREELRGAETRIALRNLYLGEDQAENEQEDLPKYFVPTAEFDAALRGTQSMIYVGRKGSGKTANLYKIAETLSHDRRNHVCVIKPIGYELEGILRLLEIKLPQAHQGYMLESLWKFMIYTELAKSVYDDMDRHPYIGKSAAEIEFHKYIRDHEDLIKPDFAVRLENAVFKLGQLDTTSSLPTQETKVSEILHSGILNHLRELLGSVLEDKEKVCVIIDNLDKSWIRGTDIRLLSDFLYALLNVIGMIAEEYNKTRPRRMAVRLSLIVFLRSDIFSYIIRAARERDKLTYIRLDWTDPTLLHRIIEERIAESSNQNLHADEVWKRIFVENIDAIPVKDYITQQIIPRPRDIIYLCKASLSHAVNRGHLQIEKDDIKQAEKEYSQYAFDSLEAEVSAQLTHMEELLYEFAGVSSIVTRAQIEGFCKNVSIDDAQIQLAINLLCEASFLGLETKQGYFEYFYPESRSDVIRTLARKLTEATGDDRYQINIPYRSYLEVKITED
jgi:Cdc6-like AAA superfamily ATPase